MEELRQEVENILSEYLALSNADQGSISYILSYRAMLAYREYVNYPKDWTEERIVEDMSRHKSCIADLALFEAIQQGAEFQSMHIESGLYRMWNNKGNVYTQHGIVPFAST